MCTHTSLLHTYIHTYIRTYIHSCLEARTKEAGHQGPQSSSDAENEGTLVCLSVCLSLSVCPSDIKALRAAQMQKMKVHLSVCLSVCLSLSICPSVYINVCVICLHTSRLVMLFPITIACMSLCVYVCIYVCRRTVCFCVYVQCNACIDPIRTPHALCVYASIYIRVNTHVYEKNCIRTCMYKHLMFVFIYVCAYMFIMACFQTSRDFKTSCDVSVCLSFVCLSFCIFCVSFYILSVCLSVFCVSVCLSRYVLKVILRVHVTV
jgi:hypothetical protein